MDIPPRASALASVVASPLADTSEVAGGSSEAPALASSSADKKEGENAREVNGAPGHSSLITYCLPPTTYRGAGGGRGNSGEEESGGGSQGVGRHRRA